MGYYLALVKKEILPLVTTWINLEGIVLSEESQTQKDKYCMLSLMCRILKSQTHESRVCC